jgi:bifunctional non-homologous end joining protein LigD
VTWDRVVAAARLVRGLLSHLGLESFLRTTGGKGLHVVVPLAPQRPWDEIKALSKSVASHLEQTLPDRFVSSMSRARRGGRIFIDYLRNASEATAVAAYSTRAKPDAPVSTPLAWDELSDAGLRSGSYSVRNLRQRLDSLKQDPWAEYFKLEQKVTDRMMEAFKD